MDELDTYPVPYESLPSAKPAPANLLQDEPTWYAILHKGSLLMKRYTPREMSMDQAVGRITIGPIVADNIQEAREIAKEIRGTS